MAEKKKTDPNKRAKRVAERRKARNVKKGERYERTASRHKKKAEKLNKKESGMGYTGKDAVKRRKTEIKKIARASSANNFQQEADRVKKTKGQGTPKKRKDLRTSKKDVNGSAKKYTAWGKVSPVSTGR